MRVFLWYGGVICPGRLERRGLHALRHCWRVHVWPGVAAYQVHYAPRRLIHLDARDCANQL